MARRKPGPAKMPPGRKRTGRMSVPVNEAEYEAIRAAAARAESAPATWARDTLVGAAKADRPPRVPSKDLRDIREALRGR